MNNPLPKVRKDPSDFEDQKPDYEKRLEIFDRKSNTNKFWRIWVYGCFVVRHWGRHGTKGQWGVWWASSSYYATEVAVDLFISKNRKGYRPEASVLDRIVREID